MKSKALVEAWFDCWESGKLDELPITESFSHTSPFGVIEPKSKYMEVVLANTEKFLDHKFVIHDAFYAPNKAVVRYTAYQAGQALNVSEWYYFEGGLIDKIIADYNVGDIEKDQRLEM